MTAGGTGDEGGLCIGGFLLVEMKPFQDALFMKKRIAVTRERDDALKGCVRMSHVLETDETLLLLFGGRGDHNRQRTESPLELHCHESIKCGRTPGWRGGRGAHRFVCGGDKHTVFIIIHIIDHHGKHEKILKKNLGILFNVRRW